MPFEGQKMFAILQRTSRCLATDGTLLDNGWSVATQRGIRCKAKCTVLDLLDSS